MIEARDKILSVYSVDTSLTSIERIINSFNLGKTDVDCVVSTCDYRTLMRAFVNIIEHRNNSHSAFVQSKFREPINDHN